jgi:hypothetical protein
MKAIPQQEFQQYFEQWQHSWAECTGAQREYFDGAPSVSCMYTGALAKKSLRKINSHSS